MRHNDFCTSLTYRTPSNPCRRAALLSIAAALLSIASVLCLLALPLCAQTSAPAAQAAAQEKAARLALITKPLSRNLAVPQQRHFSSAHQLPGELAHLPPGSCSAPPTIYDTPPTRH